MFSDRPADLRLRFATRPSFGGGGDAARLLHLQHRRRHRLHFGFRLRLSTSVDSSHTHQNRDSVSVGADNTLHQTGPRRIKDPEG